MTIEHTLSAAAQRPAIEVDVVMRREPVSGPMRRWQAWRWVLADVLLRSSPEEAAASTPAASHEPQAVEPVEGAAEHPGTHWLFPRFRVELFRDDAEGYFLNLNSPSPCFWVVWRPDDERLLDGEPMAVPQTVTLSYHDAGRWLDAQERVEQVAASDDVTDWLRGFVDATYQPEPKRRQRPQSFQPLTDRFGQPVRISTEKLRGGGHSGQ
ncbi:DUF3305 domain-containing protein [Hydrogenophaga taeniospiralis]|uniref:DUF3305 domain-containing protein n=1 Tax=Hydrogenophaga taeniospiralis TaxID=65656 RepID=UPI001CFBF7BC|nr:DUF3305 domain-containing protein [Hydrogenophaga taeniospiralis]MCB4366539.1 DUF3305 domain-containing protein [Hydrogenophaga taeniospiralis]